MENDLRARLLASLTCPVDWGWSPQGSPLPRVVLTLVSDVPVYSQDGASTLSHARVQLDCYAAGQGAAVLLARQVQSALSGYVGASLLGVFLSGSADMAPDMSAGETDARRMLTAMVHHRTA